MCIKIRRWLIAMRIFGLSLQIRRNRTIMGRMVKKGGPYTSPKLVKLSAATVQYGYQTYRLLRAWELVGTARVTRFPELKTSTREERTA